MTKKWCIMIFAIMIAGTAWSVDFSMKTGIGGFIGGHFTRYSLSADGMIDARVDGDATKVPVEVFSRQEVDQLNMGGYLFVDATWAEFDVSILSGTYQYSQTMYAKSNGDVQTGSEQPETGKGWETTLGLTLLGKYPFELNEKITVFPLAGIEYQIALRELRQVDGFNVHDRTDGIHEMNDSNGKPYTLSAWNAMFIVLGGGIDFNVHAPIFLRAELLYNIRLQTPWETDSLKTLKQAVNAPNPTLAGLSSGPVLKVAVGWDFD